jgi:ATP citrate (pro-S)-lyase
MILSEYLTKTLYYKFINQKYNGIILKKETIPFFVKNLFTNKKLTIKPDQEIKRRGKLGLVKHNLQFEEISETIKELSEKDINIDGNKIVLDTFLVEETQNIKEEHYLAIRNNIDYDEILFNQEGGVDVGDVESKVTIIKIPIIEGVENVGKYINELKLNNDLTNTIINIYQFFVKYHLTFLEINPLCLIEGSNHYIPIDFAVKIDPTSLYLFDDIPNNSNKITTPEEKFIHELDEKTGASLKLTILNPRGGVWLMVAGGGASVVYTDAVVNLGYYQELGNYGEYSGNPSLEFTYLYAKTVIQLMLKYKEVKNKILFIGGGIANFTDIKATFQGLIKAIDDFSSDIVEQQIKIYVRRGGPNYQAGLQEMAEILSKLQIPHIINGPNDPITNIVIHALENKNNEERKPVVLDKNNLILLEIPVKKNIIMPKVHQCIIYGNQQKVLQRMANYDYLIGKEKCSVLCLVDVSKKSVQMVSFYWREKQLLIPVYPCLKLALQKFTEVNHVINFSSFRSAYHTTKECISYNNINLVTVIAEGMPERQSRLLKLEAGNLGKIIIGPSTVGMIKPGIVRIGNTCGNLDNIIDSRLYKSGSVAFVTRSGGLLNEMCRIISKHCDGIYEGISIGGDKYPCSNFIDHVIRFENNEEVKLIVMLGEIGGKQEILVSNCKQIGIITKPIIGWCTGIAAEKMDKNMQFGHAGASANIETESAVYKNSYMKASGILVPESFETISDLIKEQSEKIGINNIIDDNSNYNQIINTIEKRKPAKFFSSISKEYGDELQYNGVNITEIYNNDSNFGNVIGLLWLKKNVSQKVAKYFELILILCADHGPAVSGAQNTIVSARAGKDMISSIVSGLLTIGDKFGGALNGAAKYFYQAYHQKQSAKDFVDTMKKNNMYIPGIGHRIKSSNNPDKRVEVMKEFLNKNFKNMEYTNYALEVEQVTLKKRSNLILNVDGLIAVSLIDVLLESKTCDQNQIEEMINQEIFNAFFVLARCCGFIGHYIDQKRLKQGLYRCPRDDIVYL